MGFNFIDFTDIEFPKHKEIVYVLYFREKDSGNEIPLYVGESSRGVGRFGDYLSAKFTAPTDFKVGEAIRHLRNLGFTVRIKYKESGDRKIEEREIINQLQGNSRLLNELEGFDYKGSNENDERARIHNFVTILLQEKGSRKDAIKVQQPLIATPETNPINDQASIPDTIRAICEDLGEGGRIILRKDILARARQRGINQSSIMPADYCDNTATGKWSRHSFLHSVGRGKYVLRNFDRNAENE